MLAGPPISRHSVRGGCRPSLRHQVQKDLLVPLGAPERGGSLAANLVAVGGAPLAQASKGRLHGIRVADDASLPHLTAQDLELRLEQRYDFCLGSSMSQCGQYL